MKTIYVVHMLRYGNRELHSYVLGAFSNKLSAMQAGEAECVYRGGKYEPDIVECVLDADMQMDEELTISSCLKNKSSDDE